MTESKAAVKLPPLLPSLAIPFSPHAARTRRVLGADLANPPGVLDALLLRALRHNPLERSPAVAFMVGAHRVCFLSVTR